MTLRNQQNDTPVSIDRKNSTRIIVKWIIILVVMVGVYFWQQDLFHDAFREIAERPLYLDILSMSAALVYFLVEGGIISRMTKYAAARMPYWKGVKVALICAFYRLVTLGTGNGIMQVYYYNKEGIPVSEGTGMSLVQYTFQKITVGILGIIGFIILLCTDQQGILEYKKYLYLGVVMISLIVTALILITTSKWIAGLAERIVNRLLREGTRFADKRESLIGQIRLFNKEGRSIWGHPGMAFSIIGLNILKLGSWYIIPGILFFAGDMENMFISLCLMAVVFMISGVMVSPASIGTLEFVFILLYTSMVAEEVAAAGVILYRFFTWIVPFMIGAVLSGLDRGGRKRVEEDCTKAADASTVSKGEREE